MKQGIYFIACILCTSTFVFGQKPKVVVLGVEHSAQLINFNHQPAALRSFIEKVKPSAICIERSPEEYSKRDFYEFTYEQQYVVIPYAEKKIISLHPIDWLPEKRDSELAFGTSNLEVPNFTRRPQGFWGFLTFSDSTAFNKSIYFADDEQYPVQNQGWYKNYSDQVNYDFPRRLFLYRTFLQSKRIQYALKNYTEEDTVLVVIGGLHKDDIEKNLLGNGFEIIRPSSFGEISREEINKNFEPIDAYAILSFNLLGMQSSINNINYPLVRFAIEKLKNVNTLELDLLKTKYELLSSQINSKTAIVKYKDLLSKSKDMTFTWNGVKDISRVDSYFDPFGNLSVKQRIRLELAREYLKTSNKILYQQEKELLIQEFSGFKKNMLLEYIDTYLK